MGSAIITAITSGLGLIEDLAEEFADGFKALVWDTTLNSGAGGLTPVATFGFVMIGISVSFGVVRLVLNLIRGNTGM